jgi:uncharacterized protein (TIGR03437 family)
MLDRETKAKLKRRFKENSRDLKYNSRMWRFWLLLAAVAAAPLRIDAQCTYSVSAVSILVDAPGTPVTAPRSFTVTTQAGCSTSVTAGADWIAIVGNANGIGSRTITFSVRANPGVVARTARLTVGTATVTVQQSANCTFSLNPLSAAIPAGGATGRTIAVTTPSYCERTAVAGEPWITITAGAGTGSGSVIYSVEPNLSPQPRAGTITIVNRTFSVNQEASNCAYAVVLEGAPATIPVGGGSYPLTVTTSCRWTLTANVPWIEIRPPDSGLGNGRTAAVILGNDGTADRSGQILAPAGGLNVVQAGRGCMVTVEPPNVLAASAARTGSTALRSACPWTAVSDSAWLRLTQGSQGSGDGAIQWALDENTGTQPRTGVITIRTATASAARVVIQQASRAPFLTIDSVVNAASFCGGSISPGEIMTAFGLNLGPREPAGLQLSSDGRFVLSETAGVRVLVDGIPAPITYASADQVNFVAPYGIAGRTQSEIRAQYNGLLSEPVVLPAAAANPEIFPVGTAGQGAILNADGTPNSTAQPARRGSVIQIFATGFGATRPPGLDGFVPAAAPLPEPSLRVRVFASGQECRLLYAGAAPLLVSGVIQINCELPIPVTGVAEISVFAGDRRNRARATVAVE